MVNCNAKGDRQGQRWVPPESGTGSRRLHCGARRFYICRDRPLRV